MKIRASLVLFLVLIIPVAVPAFAVAASHIAADAASAKKTRNAVSPAEFARAVDLMRAGDYTKSLARFNSVRQAFPFMEDYALYFEAGIYGHLMDRARSLQCLERLIKEDPESPLVMRARLRIINETRDKKKLVRLLSDFTERYPGQGRMSLRLAGLLKEEGRRNRAEKILGRLYAGGGKNLSDDALAELGRPPTEEEMVARTRNLLSLNEAQEAESELLRLPDDPAYRKERLDLLGRALFQQKNYSKAASVYSAAGDEYGAGRACARASDIDGLKQAISALSIKNSHDRRVAYLRLTLASMERRNGDWKDALSELQKTAALYPAAAEKAGWRIAWLYYMERRYRDALDVLSSLAGRYGRPKYYYWMAKSLENVGGVRNRRAAMAIYERLADGYDDYYAVLASLKTGISIQRPVPAPTVCQLQAERTAFERFDMLTQAGLGQEAMEDLLYSSRRLTDPGALIEIARRLDKAGAFRSAIAVALELPGGMRPRDVMYPKAFWRYIREECPHLNPYLVLSVMREESAYDPDACSRTGAIGLMQVEPRTAKKYCRFLDIRLDGHKDIYRVGLNLALGSYYLEKLYRQFGAVGPALAAYNAGPDVVSAWLSSANYRGLDEFVEDIPFLETKNYVKRIITAYYKYHGPGSLRTRAWFRVAMTHGKFLKRARQKSLAANGEK